MSYYFLIAQLPSLTYGQPAPMSSAAFVELCAGALSKADAELLPCCVFGAEGAEAPAETASQFINKWRERERTLVFNLAEARASKLKRESAGAVARDNAEAESQAKSALAMDNPLEAELFIDKGRWDAIEALAGVSYFGVNIIYAYLLKLRLLERRMSFKTEDGFTEYKALYDGILERAPRAGAA
ncbi:MAG: hypothetical protein LBG79_05975 [Spirochaetaceae bacterium]|nr:hypothetical protein [Spirochaetaceae bacterium]